jgi:diadenosine tetraphosphate (Ap4A) HIT family hydrolase
LYQNNDVMVLLHEDRAVRGHAMVVWKRHVENISDLTTAEAAELTRVYYGAERALLGAAGADRAVMLKLGIQTPHLHLHIYPVSSALTRKQVMEIIDARVRDGMTAEEEAAFVNDVRERLLTAAAE